MMRPRATRFFFHFLKNFSIFSLSLSPFILVAPSSLSLLPPGCSFLLVPPFSLLLFPVCPSFFLVYHLEFLKVPKHPFFTEFDKSVTDQRTVKASYRYARTHLKSKRWCKWPRCRCAYLTWTNHVTHSESFINSLCFKDHLKMILSIMICPNCGILKRCISKNNWDQWHLGKPVLHWRLLSNQENTWMHHQCHHPTFPSIGDNCQLWW